MNTPFKNSDDGSTCSFLTKLDDDTIDDMDFQVFAKDLWKLMQAEKYKDLRKAQTKLLKSLSRLLNTIDCEAGMSMSITSTEGRSQVMILQRANVILDHLIKVNRDLKRKRLYLKKKIDEKKMKELKIKRDKKSNPTYIVLSPSNAGSGMAQCLQNSCSYL